MIYVSYGEVDQEEGRFNEELRFIARKNRELPSGEFTVKSNKLYYANDLFELQHIIDQPFAFGFLEPVEGGRMDDFTVGIIGFFSVDDGVFPWKKTVRSSTDLRLKFTSSKMPSAMLVRNISWKADSG